MIGTNRVLPAGVATPARVASGGEQASVRFLEFFASVIRNPHTRRAYARVGGWHDAPGPSIAAVQSLPVAAWVELQTQTSSAPTVKQQLAAIRHLFD